MDRRHDGKSSSQSSQTSRDNATRYSQSDFITRATKTTSTRTKRSHRAGNKGSHQRGKKWSGKVDTDSTHPPAGTFNEDAESIARIMSKKSVSPKGLGSAIRMVQFYINRAGKDLAASRRRELEKARAILQEKRHERAGQGKSN